ncbi:hypothetical protein [Heyndrickxia sporothermodurans]|uniref:hypothetical protein n=1 Tax=Heyndrickxia sporothermodurans TaxID=46224 RepID=UPI0035D77C74
MKVTIKDTNNIPAIKKQLRQLEKSSLKVGVFGDFADEIVTIARVHEYGCDISVTPKMRKWFAANGYPLKKTTTVIKIAERSWLRSGYDENIDKIVREIETFVPDIFENNVNIDVFMNQIGKEFASLIQKKLRAITNPPNSAMTIERKGSSNPLIDSGRLVQSIEHRVE